MSHLSQQPPGHASTGFGDTAQTLVVLTTIATARCQPPIVGEAVRTREAVTPGAAPGAFDNELIPVVGVIDFGSGTYSVTIHGADDTLGEYVLVDPPANRVDALVGSAILAARVETSFALRTTEGEQPQPT